MRLTKPRIPPLDEKTWNDEQRELLTRGNPKTILNVFRTIATHTDLFRRWLPFGNHVLYKSTLPPREREILILRTGALCRSDYEFQQHRVVGRQVGLTDAEIERIKRGADAPEWTPFERALIRAVDELHEDAFISDETWSELSRRYDTKQLMDLVFTVGQYQLVSMALNTFGVQLEDTVEGPPLPRHPA